MSVWDSISFNNRFTALPRLFYTPIQPTPLSNVQWLAWNHNLANELGFPSFENASEELLETLSGNVEPEQFSPLAMKYAGHQFGSYNPDLGDGRGLLLTQVVAKSGETFDLHLKGAGKTPIHVWAMVERLFAQRFVSIYVAKRWRVLISQPHVRWR